MPVRRPTVGQIVHYTARHDAWGNLWPDDVPATEDDIAPAIITSAKLVDAPAGEHYTIAVSLLVFLPKGRTTPLSNVPYSAAPLARGCWNWPPPFDDF